MSTRDSRYGPPTLNVDPNCEWPAKLVPNTAQPIRADRPVMSSCCPGIEIFGTRPRSGMPIHSRPTTARSACAAAGANRDGAGLQFAVETIGGDHREEVDVGSED
jgi:hypothetical protein